MTPGVTGVGVTMRRSETLVGVAAAPGLGVALSSPSRNVVEQPASSDALRVATITSRALHQTPLTPRRCPARTVTLVPDPNHHSPLPAADDDTGLQVLGVLVRNVSPPAIRSSPGARSCSRGVRAGSGRADRHPSGQVAHQCLSSMCGCREGGAVPRVTAIGATKDEQVEPSWLAVSE